MKKQIYLSLCIAALLFAIYGCQSMKSIVKTPTVNFDQVEVKDASLFQSTLDLLFKVNNPNPVGLKLEEIRYNFSIDGKTIFDGVQPQGVNIPKMGANIASLPVRVNYMESADSLLNMFGKKNLPYKISGSFKLGIFNIPFSHEGTITLPTPPKISIKDIKIVSMGLAGAKINTKIEIKNDNEYSMDLKTLKYKISLGGYSLMEGKSENIIINQDKQSKVLDVPLSLNFIAVGKGIMSLFTEQTIKYEIDGDMVFEIPEYGSQSFPYKKSGEANLYR